MWIFISVFIILISLLLLYWLFKQPVDMSLLTAAIAQLNLIRFLDLSNQ